MDSLTSMTESQSRFEAAMFMGYEGVTRLPVLLILSHVADFHQKVLKVFALSEPTVKLAAHRSAGSVYAVLFHVSTVMATLALTRKSSYGCCCLDTMVVFAQLRPSHF